MGTLDCCCNLMCETNLECHNAIMFIIQVQFCTWITTLCTHPPWNVGMVHVYRFRSLDPPQVSCRASFQALDVTWVQIYGEFTYIQHNDEIFMSFLEGWLESIGEAAPAGFTDAFLRQEGNGGAAQEITEARASSERISTRPELWSNPIPLFEWRP